LVDITWITSSAAGSGILFAVISQSITKGKTESVTSKALRFTLGRKERRWLTEQKACDIMETYPGGNPDIWKQ
jgi:hypothetical protein